MPFANTIKFRNHLPLEGEAIENTANISTNYIHFFIELTRRNL